jgi:hypothetical protein
MQWHDFENTLVSLGVWYETINDFWLCYLDVGRTCDAMVLNP